MSVTIRTRELANGRLTLFLDFYPPIIGVNGKPTRREFLNRTIFKKPKNDDEKRLNKENMLFAETLRLKREKQILNEEDGIYNKDNKDIDFIQFFQELADNRRESKGNYDNWLSSLNHFKRFTIGKCKMNEINEKFCNRFKEYLLKAERINSVKSIKLSQNAASSYYNNFRAAVTEAFEQRLLNENPLKYVKGIKTKETKRDFLTQEELQKLVETDCDLKEIKTAALFSALTGLRWSDIEKLKWSDIQKTKTGYFIHITQQKTEDVVMHPISEKSVILLGKQGKPNDKIFDGLKYSDSNNDKLKRWVLKAGIHKKITLHNFRHTYATLLLNNGADILTVSKMLGHKKLETTMLYAKVLSETKIQAANIVDINL